MRKAKLIIIFSLNYIYIIAQSVFFWSHGHLCSVWAWPLSLTILKALTCTVQNKSTHSINNHAVYCADPRSVQENWWLNRFPAALLSFTHTNGTVSLFNWKVFLQGKTNRFIPALEEQLLNIERCAPWEINTVLQQDKRQKRQEIKQIMRP